MVLAALVVLGSYALVEPMRANAAGAEAESKEAAREAWRQGNAAYNLGHYVEAAKSYEDAYKLVQDPAFLFNIAQSLRLANMPEQAIDRYRAFLRTAPAESPNREVALKFSEELKKELKRRAEAKSEAAVVAPAATDPAQGAAPVPAVPAAAPSAATAAVPAPESPAPAVAPAAAPLNLVPTQPPVDTSAALTSAPPPAEAGPETPFYKAWWFWTGVGGVVVAGTVTAILLANRPGTNACGGTSLTCAEVK
jgi:hypothetical protein